MIGLFQLGQFKLSSGRESFWKIDCDSFVTEDWKTLALIVAERLDFSKVIPVPKGKSESPIDNARRFAEALDEHKQKMTQRAIIVDDVYTTGSSLRATRLAAVEKAGIGCFYTGVVVFARAPVADRWVEPIWRFW